MHNFTTASEQPDLQEILDYAALAEDLGLDSVFAWDHIILGSRTPFPVLDSLVTLAAIAMRTRRVRIGTGVLVLPLRNPVVLAKQTATIDLLSGGRLTLGVGVGWYGKEFDAVGVDLASRGSVFSKNIQILYDLWSGDLITREEPPHRFKNVVMLPTPVQRPRPEVLIGGYVDAALRRVGKFADGWLTYLYTPAAFARSWQRVREHAEELGRDPGTLTNISQLPICVAGSFEEADRRIRSFLTANVDLPAWSDCSFDSAVRGTPEECAQQLAAHISAGVQHFVLIPEEYSEEQLRAIADEVVPRVRRKHAHG